MRTKAVAVSVLALAVLAGGLVAGPLSPSAGPVSATYKTLAEVEPRIAINLTNTPGDADSVYRITLPGSYYLTGNLTGVSGKHLIEVASSNVSIDLCGFTLAGVGNAGFAVINDGSRVCISVANGAIYGWPDRGIDLSQPAAVTSSCRISNVRFANCGVTAVEVGNSTLVDSCSFINCGHAVSTGSESLVRSCVIEGPSQQGIGLAEGSMAVDCTVRGCETGVALQDPRCTLRGCTISGGSIGVSSDNDCTIEDNHVSGVSSTGIIAERGCRVAGNSVMDCTSIGIWARAPYIVLSGNQVRDVRNAGGTAAAVLLSNSATRVSVHHNSISDSDIGISVTLTSNAIYSNEMTSNTTQANIVAGNRVGALVAGAFAGAINGGTGGSGMGSTDPYANILY